MKTKLVIIELATLLAARMTTVEIAEGERRYLKPKRESEFFHT